VTEIDISFEGLDSPPWSDKVKPYLQWVLQNLGIFTYEISVLFCDNPRIAELNKQYRQKEGPTDVLSFVMDPKDNPDLDQVSGQGLVVWGDLVVSLPYVQSNAPEYGVSYEEELRRVLLHGILHLAGLDHETNAVDEPMLQKQEEILKSYQGSLF
jgi:probable rRNA maturation factor